MGLDSRVNEGEHARRAILGSGVSPGLRAKLKLANPASDSLRKFLFVIRDILHELLEVGANGDTVIFARR